ncbi:MAG TPA: hypothetical protein VM912_21520 [Terriglobales bacterium]|nr:hypothetical protein [Terriglobales bacterium]
MATAHITTPFAFTSKPARKRTPVFTADHPIDLQALIAKLSPDQLAEAFAIECYAVDSRMFREIWSHLGPQQQAFLDVLVWGFDNSLSDIKEALGLSSVEEAEQILVELRAQLRAMGIDPQEIYHADYRITGRDHKLEANYYANWPFAEAHQREFVSKNPKQRKLREKWLELRSGKSNEAHQA